MVRWLKGDQTVQFLIDRGRLESFEGQALAGLAEAQISRAALRLKATAEAALGNGDVDGHTPPPMTPTGWPPRRF
jgi:hypothetical protein